MSTFTTVIPPRGDLDWCWFLRKHGVVGEVLERALHDIGVLHPGGWADWTPSTMTGTGAPIEMCFNADPTTLCLRTEVDNPGVDPLLRLAKANALAHHFGQVSMPAALREVIAMAQITAPLQFGAWLGLESRADHLGCTLYAELPAHARDLTGLLAPHRATDALIGMGDDIRLRMVGYDCTTGQVSLFGVTDSGGVNIVSELAQIAGVPFAPLQYSLAQLRSPDVTAELGFCLTLGESAARPDLSVQFAAQDLIGDDQAIKKAICAYPGDHHAQYASLADIVSTAPDVAAMHGAISLRACHDALAHMSVRLAAPWHGAVGHV